MNRIGFTIALCVAVVGGVLFGVFAQLDLDLAGLFFNPATHTFKVNAEPWVRHSRDASRWFIALLSAPAAVAIFGKLIVPHRRILIGGETAVFLLLTLALGPGILANVVLKEHWGRSRPIDVTDFAGTDHFTPWWDPRGECPSNCSFVAGEPSGAFWTLAPAALAPPQWRVLAYAGALGFGVAVGLLRMAAGAHFFTDVMFAGIFMYLVVWVMHGFIFRWRTSRMRNDALEHVLARVGVAMRKGLAAFRRRIGWRIGKL